MNQNESPPPPYDLSNTLPSHTILDIDHSSSYKQSVHSRLVRRQSLDKLRKSSPQQLIKTSKVKKCIFDSDVEKSSDSEYHKRKFIKCHKKIIKCHKRNFTKYISDSDSESSPNFYKTQCNQSFNNQTNHKYIRNYNQIREIYNKTPSSTTHANNTLPMTRICACVIC